MYTMYISTLSENAQTVLTYAWHESLLEMIAMCTDNRKHCCQTNIGKKEVNNQHYNAIIYLQSPNNHLQIHYCMENPFWDRPCKSFQGLFYNLL